MSTEQIQGLYICMTMTLMILVISPAVVFGLGKRSV